MLGSLRKRDKRERREKARGREREKEGKEGEIERDRGDRGSHNATAANGVVALLESYSKDKSWRAVDVNILACAPINMR